MPNYGNIANSTQTGRKGGYKPAMYFAETSDIATWARPIASPVAIGDTVKITTAHTFASGKCALIWEGQIHSVTITGEPVGEDGAKEIEYTATIAILGDNAATAEQMIRALNDQKVCWFKDADCLTNDSYVQLGDDCNPVEASAAFNGGTTKEGQKKYTLTVKSKTKYFYLAALDTTP